MLQLDFITFFLQIAIMFLLSWSTQLFLTKRVLPSKIHYNINRKLLWDHMNVFIIKYKLISINFVVLLFSVIFLISSLTFNIAITNIESINTETVETTSLGYLNSILVIKIIFIFQFIKHIYYSIQSLFFDYVNTNISEHVVVMISFKKKLEKKFKKSLKKV